MNMHNFGEKRWGDGLIDDIRSQTEQNTRVVGDFTKSVSVLPIIEEMHSIFAHSNDWELHFDKAMGTSIGTGSTTADDGTTKTDILGELKTLKDNAKQWKRKRLQTRFFETGDNYYLGMEFTREYDKWKNMIAERCAKKQEIIALLDRLWYEAAFAVLQQGDVSR